MAQIGQLIYNLQDYVNSGGYISTSDSNLNSTISSVDGQEAYESGKIDIFTKNIVSRYGKTFSRLGIQAPPGTKVIIDTDKTILVGQNGIYELDEDIAISSLTFIRPRRYIKDVDQTTVELNAGIEGMQAAEDERAQELADLEVDKNNLTEEEYWKKYTDIQTVYNEKYEAALDHFNNGINGVYKLDPDNPYQDLYNIIIDFIY